MNTVAAAGKFHDLITRKTLIARVQSGDDVAWEDFYNTYKGFIKGVAQRLRFSNNSRLSDEDIADLIHIVMLDLWNPEKPKYDPARGIKFRTWFGQIVRNKFYDLNRKKTKFKPVDCSEVAEEDYEKHVPLHDPMKDFQKVWDEEYGKVIFAESMKFLRNEIEPVTFTAFEMFLAGQSSKEIAKSLGIKENNVYQIKSRCIGQLRKIYEKLEQDL